MKESFKANYYRCLIQMENGTETDVIITNKSLQEKEAKALLMERQRQIVGFEAISEKEFINGEDIVFSHLIVF